MLHEDEFNNNAEVVERYFKMIHYLDDVKSCLYISLPVDIKKDLDKLVIQINDSYQHENITISKVKLLEIIDSPQFNNRLWRKIEKDGKIIGSILALIDKEINEGIIDYIQVSPEYRNKNYGKELLIDCLNEFKDMADFVTVSGRIGNITNPRKLYASCGFKGNDIWYICKK